MARGVIFMKLSDLVTQRASKMFLGTFISRLLGLLRDALLAAFFSRTVTDIFVVAFKLPNFFRRLLGEGALGASFIPIYVEKMSQGKHEVFKGGVFTFLLSLVLTMTFLGIIFMDDLLNLILSGGSFDLVEGKFDQTVFLSRLMFFYFSLVTFFAYFMSILNVHKSFFWPAVAPAFFNFTFILFIFLSYFSSHTASPHVLAFGVLCGGVFQLIVVTLDLISKKAFPRFIFKWKNSGVMEFLTQLFPVIITLGVMQLISFVNIYFASFLPEGSHSYLYWADRLLELPLSLLAVSLGAALLPSLSSLFVSKKHKEFLELSQSHLKFLIFLVLPASVGLFLLAEPFVELLYKRGEFSDTDLEKTAQIVKFYSLILISASFFRVIISHFYAIKKVWWPFLISAVGLILHILLASYFISLGYGLKGLVFSMCLVSFFNLLLSLILYIKEFGFHVLKPVFKLGLLCLIPLFIMGCFIFYFYSFFKIYASYFLLKLILILFIVFLSCVIYIGIHYLFKTPESFKFLSFFKK